MSPMMLPDAEGKLVPYQPRIQPLDLALDPNVPPVRAAYAAAHLVANPQFDAEAEGGITPDAVDWEATLAYREYLWSLGFGVAEAMDTAQRGAEIDWEVASVLLDLTLAKAREQPGRRVIAGAAADSVDDPATCTLTDVIDSYVAQARFIEQRGGQVILFPTPVLPERFPEPEDYRELIRHIASRVEGPLYLHWLGRQFDARMAGYWGHADPCRAATEVVIPLMAEHADKIKGIKLSLLDQQFEEWFRAQIRPHGQVVLTGDDLNFAQLIKGREAPGDFSHALLGIFDAIAPVAAKALQHLARGETDDYDRLIGPTVQLSRHVFAPPTQYYKVGLVFLAYLNGHQNHFRMVGGIEGHRSLRHLVALFGLADRAGVLADPADAYQRFRPILRLGGYEV